MRRIQSLQRFLLEQLHHELSSRASIPQPQPPTHEAAAAGTGQAAAPDDQAAAAEEEGGQGAGGGPASPPVQEPLTTIERVFGMPLRQRTQCLGGDRAEAYRDTRTFQVCGLCTPAQ